MIEFLYGLGMVYLFRVIKWWTFWFKMPAKVNNVQLNWAAVLICLVFFRRSNNELSSPRSL